MMKSTHLISFCQFTESKIDKSFNYSYRHVGLNEKKEANIIEEFDARIEELLNQL